MKATILPFKPQGIENKTTETISDLCALGRSYNLAIILLSQGIAGEIGINAAIRRNLNTQFIGKLNPLDLDEAVRLLGQVDINPKYLILMPVGDFYIAGKMNLPLFLCLSTLTFQNRKKLRTNRASDRHEHQASEDVHRNGRRFPRECSINSSNLLQKRLPAQN